MKRTTLAVLAPILLLLGYCAFEELRPPDTRAFARSVFGLDVQLGDPDVHIATGRSWQGDGFSFDRYPISRAILAQFADSSARMDTFPVFPDFRTAWRCKTWRRTPSSSGDSTALRTVLAQAPSNAAADARRALGEPGNWYSLCVKALHEESFHMNVDLYLLDARQSTFVLANFQM